LSRAPLSIVLLDAERETYLVLDDFGGDSIAARRESDADRATLIQKGIR